MKRAVVLLVALTALCSGCGTKQPQPAPLVLNLPDCPAPVPPVLPTVDGTLPFDGPENMAKLAERDDMVRVYVEGLEAAIRCYRRGKVNNESK